MLSAVIAGAGSLEVIPDSPVVEWAKQPRPAGDGLVLSEREEGPGALPPAIHNGTTSVSTGKDSRHYDSLGWCCLAENCRGSRIFLGGWVDCIKGVSVKQEL
jgi:hypothetical protein